VCLRFSCAPALAWKTNIAAYFAKSTPHWSHFPPWS
jgi:hypothetical protein